MEILFFFFLLKSTNDNNFINCIIKMKKKNAPSFFCFTFFFLPPSKQRFLLLSPSLTQIKNNFKIFIVLNNFSCIHTHWQKKFFNLSNFASRNVIEFFNPSSSFFTFLKSWILLSTSST